MKNTLLLCFVLNFSICMYENFRLCCEYERYKSFGCVSQDYISDEIEQNADMDFRIN